MASPVLLDDTSVVPYLGDTGLFDRGESLTVEPAGDGNINWVRRVRSGSKSVIVKQARSALEKFPEYSADPARLSCEARYFEIAGALSDDGVLPAVLHFDEANHVLVLQDIGDVPGWARASRPAQISTRISKCWPDSCRVFTA